MKPAHSVRIAVAKAYNRLPHELGRLPITYFQTLLMDLIETNRRAAKSSKEDDGDVDVDAMIRKGTKTGFTNG